MQQRLFQITYLLTGHKGMTADELARRLDVSRRTIYRDIDALSSAGIPVYAEKGRGGGIRILPDFVLDKSLFTGEERAQLVAQFQSLASIGTPDADNVLNKLAALFGRQDSWLEVDFAPWDGGTAAREMIRRLREAILHRQPVSFCYTGAGGKTSARTAEPARIVFRGQGWYLQAFCLKRQEFRFFKLTRIRDLAVQPGTFGPQELPAAGQQNYTGKLVALEIRFSARASYRVHDEFPPEQVQQAPGGNLLVHCTMPQDEWLFGYLLSYGDTAEVLSPADIRQAIRQRAQKTADNYKK